MKSKAPIEDEHVFANQKRQIESYLGQPSAQFQRYAKKYLLEISGSTSFVAQTRLKNAVQSAQVVWCGDYHAHAPTQRNFLKWASAAAKKRDIIFALEFVKQNQQPFLERYLDGTVTESQLQTLLGHDEPFSFWPNMAPILRFAKQHEIPAYGIDRSSHGKQSLEQRDKFASGVIRKIRNEHSNAQIWVLMGQYHLAKSHLPGAYRRLKPKDTTVTLFQNAEHPTWSGLKKKVKLPFVQQLSQNEFNVATFTPSTLQASFIRHIEKALRSVHE